MDAWEAVGALGSFAAAVVAALAAYQSRSSAREANAAATTMAEIERERRHGELCPRFRVSCDPVAPGPNTRRLHVMLLGPPGLDHLDSLTVTIRDDQFTRGEGPLHAGSPTRDEIKQHIWGPFQFTPSTGPDEARSDRTGRVTPYTAKLPVGEELVYQLQPTTAPPWAEHMTSENWKQQHPPVIRLSLEAHHATYGSWTVPCEIDVGDEAARPVVCAPNG
jgi:hypothetical protein